MSLQKGALNKRTPSTSSSAQGALTGNKAMSVEALRKHLAGSRSGWTRFGPLSTVHALCSQLGGEVVEPVTDGAAAP
eukprot:CAMPEP_0203794924 /NCGR_PEP_ID=MMETSP0100_2-20121128/6860_1 /ASSEMBLY_ACC=CAM_ASM_000210 /TAXON_ID=96639 /ORGANISM=" , Strain NY0313808BC1" /LENGTH=76 /DNA_ID=CAMNT_0050699207 /DNA_START=263 /DNA_END=493 /DNA_ORIENTATION=+